MALPPTEEQSRGNDLPRYGELSHRVSSRAPPLTHVRRRICTFPQRQRRELMQPNFVDRLLTPIRHKIECLVILIHTEHTGLRHQ